ncbi:MAG: hypothetical protein H0T73_03365 [Ardenticatenales bacterium]|nr:hypothetical protein [Ardenticatenales bacterium]
MWEDPIVEETRKIRQAYTAQFDNDLEAIFRDLKAKEQATEREVVSLPPRKPIQTTSNVS